MPKAETAEQARRVVVSREAQLSRISAMMLHGHTDVYEIAAEVGLSVATVRASTRLLEKRWERQAMTNLVAVKQLKVMELDLVKKAAWAAWELSKKSKHKLTRKVVDGEKPEVTTVVEECNGDPRFLTIVRECINNQAELQGVKVSKVAPTTPDGDKSYGEGLMEKAIEIAERVGDGARIIDAKTIDAIAANAVEAQNREAAALAALDGLLEGQCTVSEELPEPGAADDAS